MGVELYRSLRDMPQLMAQVRLDLTEKVAPMSLHVGLLRVGWKDGSRLLDILYDTTDSDGNMGVFASICYLELGADLARIGNNADQSYGEIIRAY